MNIDNDVLRLRELAKQVREIADLPIQQTNRRLWEAVNDLRMIRPVLHVRDAPLYTLKYEDELTTQIEDPFLQRLEMDLLLRLYEWKHMRVDRVIEPTIKCPCVITDTGFGISATTDSTTTVAAAEGEYNSSKHFEPQILTADDLALIKTPVVTYDEAATMTNFERMQEIFAGILEVKLEGKSNFHVVPWDDLLSWMGITEGLMNFALEPELMHQAVTIYIDAAIARARQYEALGILSSNNGFVNIGNNGIGYTTQLPPPTASGIGARLQDIWGENSDQVLTAVSPDMSEEFAFPYERRYSDLFGLHSYGCCERLDHKVYGLRANFPNLRKISMSPFADLEAGMEKIGSDFVVCFKPNSNYLTGSDWSLEPLKQELIKIMALARKYNSNVEIDMKTIITLNGEPQRLWAWCDMAAEIIANY